MLPGSWTVSSASSGAGTLVIPLLANQAVVYTSVSININYNPIGSFFSGGTLICSSGANTEDDVVVHGMGYRSDDGDVIISGDGVVYCILTFTA